MEDVIKARPRSHWKIPAFESYAYKSHYCGFFSANNPEFSNRIQKDLFPIFQDIFGEHRTNPALAEFEVPILAYPILEKDCESFCQSIQVLKQNSKLSFEELEKKGIRFINNFHKILEEFKLFDENYGYETNEWLCYALFFTVYSGSIYLRPMPTSPYPLFSQEMLVELWEMFPLDFRNLVKNRAYLRHKKTGSAKFNKVLDSHFQSWETLKDTPFFPMHLPNFFLMFDSYDVFEDLQDYEKRATKFFNDALQAYLKIIQHTLKKHGYRPNKSDNYSQIEWLVIWNKYQVEYLWEIIPYIPEFSKVDPSNKIEAVNTSDKLRQAFKKCGNFGLPVRPFGKKRKNKTQKIGSNVSGKKK